MVLALAAVALAASVPAWSEASQVVRVPVSGTYYAPSVGASVAYDGILAIVWTPAPAGAGWDVVRALVAEAAIGSTGARTVISGFSQERVEGAPGAVVQLSQPVLAVGPAAGAVQGLPVSATVPASVAVAAGSGVEAVSMSVPISGGYSDPALGGEVTYQGIVHLAWTTPATGTSDWTLNGALVADATSGGGERFVLHAFCQDCFTLAPGSTVRATKPMWALGTGGLAGYQGSLTLTLTLPKGATVPQVSAVELASR